ncbi:hypothetical protein ABPG75_001974 [Micractinium tetrahymenae]
MDADEVLARQLQAEEDAALAAALGRAGLGGGGNHGQARIASLLHDSAKKALKYGDELAQAMALSVMPMDRLAGAAEEACAVSAAMGEQPPLALEDALAQELLAWFKSDFFCWVNAPPCPTCGVASTAGAGMGVPSAEEAEHGAGRVELYRCGACGSAVRFPRYNDPVKLLETRRGRCGEWANAFTLCCRAAGLDARLAIDLEDHVWTEVWSEAQQRWVHMDPCEAAYDKPLLYEAGWGKRLTYVLAVGRHGAADVTRRYTQQWGEVQKRRTLASEPWLESALQEATARLRAQLPADERQRLERRDALEQQLLLSGRTQLSPAELAALPGRTTGDAAWLAARGEDGRAGAAAQAAASGCAAASADEAAAAAADISGTRYRLAKDDGLAAAQPLRLCGGAVRASGEIAPGETARHAFDGSPHTKWLDFGGRKPDAAWLEYRLPAEAPPAVLGSYALTSANDEPARDPRHVVLEAWSEEAGDWVILAEQTALHFPARHHRQEFAIPASAAPPPSRRFRLRVVGVADPATANSVQLACLDLYRRPQQERQGQHERREQDSQLGQQGQQGQQQQQQQQEQEGAAGPTAEQQEGQPPGGLGHEQQGAAQQAAAEPSPGNGAGGAAQAQHQQQQLQAPASGSDKQDGAAGNPWAELFSAG